MNKIYTWEQTEKVESGLDVLVMKNNNVFCWCYNIEDASNITESLNKIGSLEDTLSLISHHSRDDWVTKKALEALN